MAQQIINIGAAPNDNTGDPLRTAYDKGNQNFTELYSKITPIGIVSPFAGSVAPTFWVLCNGQLLSRVTYAALFAVIGITFGAGDGVTTFGTPDVKARSIYGFDPGQATARLTAAVTGMNSGVLGATGGHQSSQSHAHNVSAFQFLVSDGNTTVAAAGGDILVPNIIGLVNTNPTGAGNAQNLPPAIVMNYIMFAGV